jgi:SAM-dependent methyltransferase
VRETAVRVGRFVAVPHADDGRLAGSAGRLAGRGFRVQETPHLVVCQRRPGGQAILLHAFTESTIDEDVSSMLENEVGALGVIASPREYGEVLFAIVASTCPTSLDCPECGRLHLDQAAIWRHFSLNTLARLRTLVSAPEPAGDSHIAVFAAIYRRILECRAGASLLDVGSNLGHLPVLLAERAPEMTVAGCDNRSESIACCRELAGAAGATRVSWRLADLLARDFPRVGRFDTVTAVHVLEHLDEDELPVALAHLVEVTARRLIVSVPYEEAVQPLYGHRQRFTPEKLRFWGEWCVRTSGRGGWDCEDVGGGFLVVDR